MGASEGGVDLEEVPIGPPGVFKAEPDDLVADSVHVGGQSGEAEGVEVGDGQEGLGVDGDGGAHARRRTRGQGVGGGGGFRGARGAAGCCGWWGRETWVRVDREEKDVGPENGAYRRPPMRLMLVSMKLDASTTRGAGGSRRVASSAGTGLEEAGFEAVCVDAEVDGLPGGARGGGAGGDHCGRQRRGRRRRGRRRHRGGCWRCWRCSCWRRRRWRCCQAGGAAGDQQVTAHLVLVDDIWQGRASGSAAALAPVSHRPSERPQ
jgi:hypothetical protein